MNAVVLRATTPRPHTLVFLALALLAGLALAALPHILLFPAFAMALVILLACLTPHAALLPLLILAPLRALIATESSLQLPLDLGQLLLLFWLTAWVMHRIVLRQRLPRLAWSPLYIPVLVFLLVAGLSAFSAVSFAGWLREWVKWLQILALIVLVGSTMQGRAWRWPLLGVLLAGAANAVVGIYQFMGGSGALHLLVNGRFFRAFGTFGQPNPFGGFMAMLAPLALCLTLASLLRWRQCRTRGAFGAVGGYAVLGVLLVAGLLASWSRGAWLAFGAASLMILIALPRRLFQGMLLGAAASLLAAAMWSAGLLPASLSERLGSATSDYFAFEDMRGVPINAANYPVVERLAHWQAALNMATAHPWLGVGLGNYEHEYERFRLLNWPAALGHAHNYWLNLLAETGIPGLAAYVGVWGSVLLLSWRALRHPDQEARLVVVGLLGAWVSLSVHSLFDNLYVNNLFLHIGVLLGVLAMIHRQARRFQACPAVAASQP